MRASIDMRSAQIRCNRMGIYASMIKHHGTGLSLEVVHHTSQAQVCLLDLDPASDNIYHTSTAVDLPRRLDRKNTFCFHLVSYVSDLSPNSRHVLSHDFGKLFFSRSSVQNCFQ